MVMMHIKYIIKQSIASFIRSKKIYTYVCIHIEKLREPPLFLYTAYYTYLPQILFATTPIILFTTKKIMFILL